MTRFDFPAYDGDDLNQDLELMRLKRRWSNPAPALIHTVRRRRKRDVTAREIRRQSVSIDRVPHPRAKNDSDPLHAAERHEDIERLRSARRRLPRNADEILRLAFDEQRSNREIAERLKINDGAVRSRLHRAVEKLRKLFGAKIGK